MALARRLRRLLSKAAQASVSRSRFSDAEAITIAFATGVVLVRAAAYTVLSLSQFSGADPTAFVAAVAGTILAVWCCTGTVALANAGARSRPALLLFGIPSAAFIQRRWILMVAMRRGLTGVAALFALPVLGVVIVRAPAPGLAEPVILVLLAVGLSVSGLLLAARHGRSLGSAASLVAPSLVCIAVAGPDLRISGGVVVPPLSNRRYAGHFCVLWPVLFASTALSPQRRCFSSLRHPAQGPSAAGDYAIAAILSDSSSESRSPLLRHECGASRHRLDLGQPILDIPSP